MESFTTVRSPSSCITKCPVISRKVFSCRIVCYPKGFPAIKIHIPIIYKRANSVVFGGFKCSRMTSAPIYESIINEGGNIYICIYYGPLCFKRNSSVNGYSAVGIRYSPVLTVYRDSCITTENTISCSCLLRE